MKVTLRHEDVLNGVRGSPWECPWAFAFARVFDLAQGPVKVTDMGLIDNDGDLLLAFSEDVATWIDGYDSLGDIDGWDKLSIYLPEGFVMPSLRRS